ncbi:MAG: helix-turn-helix domain-containing protein [Xanthomonadales bacterium]|nr:helix-turn-helix domain-containing protein [Xanthomonadales bacterium]
MLIRHSGPLPRGTVPFRTGDPFRVIRAVRSGAVKSSVVDEQGREQILGLFLPGELVGLDAIASGRHSTSGETPETTELCSFSFPEVAAPLSRLPQLARRPLELTSEAILRAPMYRGEASAEERIAAFLLEIRRRDPASAATPDCVRLRMGRRDIASELRLAPETVSRVLHRLADQGLIAIERRAVHLPDPARLARLAAPVLRE